MEVQVVSKDAIDEVNRVMADGEYRKAYTLLLKILDDDKDNVQLRFLLARCYEHLNQPFAAQRALEVVCRTCAEEQTRHDAEVELCKVMNIINEIVARNIEGRFAQEGRHTGIHM